MEFFGAQFIWPRCVYGRFCCCCWVWVCCDALNMWLWCVLSVRLAGGDDLRKYFALVAWLLQSRIYCERSKKYIFFVLQTQARGGRPNRLFAQLVRRRYSSLSHTLRTLQFFFRIIFFPRIFEIYCRSIDVLHMCDRNVEVCLYLYSGFVCLGMDHIFCSAGEIKQINSSIRLCLVCEFFAQFAERGREREIHRAAV